MNQGSFEMRDDLTEAFVALKRDLVDDAGPRISTMRNYRFAILPYKPQHEFALRRRVRRLTMELESSGWDVRSISLQKLLVARIKSHEERVLERLTERELRLAQKSPERALQYVQNKIELMIEGPDGLAADICAIIDAAQQHSPERFERTVIFMERAGALYPFIRLSALLKHLDGRTHHAPVILFYPGSRTAEGLSFMDVMPADRDYRPRIYP